MLHKHCITLIKCNVFSMSVITPLKNPALRDGFLRGVCHSLEKKSDSELNFTPENTAHMSRLHIGNSQEGNKRSKNEQF